MGRGQGKENKQIKEVALRRIKDLKDPYPAKFERINIEEIRARFEHLKPDQAAHKDIVQAAGRIIAKRGHGGLIFIDLEDSSAKIQCLLSKKDLQVSTINPDHLIVGDIVGVSGIPSRTARGEMSIKILEMTLLSKAMRGWVDKEEGLQDNELRQRMREVELLSSPEARQRFKTRARMISSIRSLLDEDDFIEVETPVLQSIYGGANANPFKTHHNSLEQNMFMRIAPELYLKRLLVGGMGNVYEIGKNFRNEGISPKHNPEFTSLELYESFADYNDAADRFEKIILSANQAVNNSSKVTLNGTEFDLAKPWKREKYRDIFLRHTGLDLNQKLSKENLESSLGREIQSSDYAKQIDEVFSEKVEPHLTEPTLVFDHPIESTPLAKKDLDNPNFVQRWEAFLGGVELANAFSELNDPQEQRERFPAEELDEDYLTSLEYGLPPCAGIGIGIDRLVTLLSGQQSIREFILFPTLKKR